MECIGNLRLPLIDTKHALHVILCAMLNHSFKRVLINTYAKNNIKRKIMR